MRSAYLLALLRASCVNGRHAERRQAAISDSPSVPAPNPSTDPSNPSGLPSVQPSEIPTSSPSPSASSNPSNAFPPASQSVTSSQPSEVAPGYPLGPPSSSSGDTLPGYSGSPPPPPYSGAPGYSNTYPYPPDVTSTLPSPPSTSSTLSSSTGSTPAGSDAPGVTPISSPYGNQAYPPTPGSSVIVSTEFGQGCNDGCTINAEDGNLDWYWKSTYSFAPSTISLILNDEDPFHPTTTGYSVVFPLQTLNITDLVVSSTTDYTSTSTTTYTYDGTTVCHTIRTTYHYPVPGPTAPVTIPITQVETIPIPTTSTFSSGESFDIGKYQFTRGPAEVTYPGPDGSSYIQTFPTAFLRFSQYDAVTRRSTRINGRDCCVVTSKLYSLPDASDVDIALSTSDFDGVVEVGGPLPTIFTSNLPATEATCTLGSYRAIPTVYIVVDLVYAAVAVLAITATTVTIPASTSSFANPPSPVTNTHSPGRGTIFPPPLPPSTFRPSPGATLDQPSPHQSVGTITYTYKCLGTTCGVSVTGPHIVSGGQTLQQNGGDDFSFNIPAPTAHGQAPLGPAKPPAVSLTPQSVTISTDRPADRPSQPTPTSTDFSDTTNPAGLDGIISIIGLPIPTTSPGANKVLTMGDVTLSENGPGDFILPDGQTLTPGGVVTSAGHTLSLGSSGNVITLDGHTSTLSSDDATTTQNMGGLIMSGLGGDSSSSASSEQSGAAAPTAMAVGATGRTLLLGALLGFLGV